MTKRNPFNELGETLEALVEQDEMVGQRGPQGARGERKRPRYRSEEQRMRATIDTDLEPCVMEVLRKLAANPPEGYGKGPIRVGDLATAILVSGLVEFFCGELQVEAEWTSQSRGQRRIELTQNLAEIWDRMVCDLGIERFGE